MNLSVPYVNKVRGGARIFKKGGKDAGQGWDKQKLYNIRGEGGKNDWDSGLRRTNINCQRRAEVLFNKEKVQESKVVYKLSTEKKELRRIGFIVNYASGRNKLRFVQQ